MISSDTLELPASESMIMSKIKRPALAYLRTSSATNVGEDKDSDKRQMATIRAYAARAGYEIVLPPFYDAAVSGADPLEGRAGFAQMMAYLGSHPECTAIIVEDASRFVRGVVLQELGYQMLKGMGMTLIPANAPTHFEQETDPMTDAIRQMIGVMNELARKTLVLNLRLARDRKRAATGRKVGGRKSHQERAPEVVTLAKELRWVNKRMRERRSLRDIATELATRGHVSESGKPYGPSAIRSMLTA
jgi:DNA invertase Pin-like site-specific DNA recombinase